MTDDVAALVLRDNYFQTQALSVGARLGPSYLDQEARFIRFLEKTGRPEPRHRVPADRRRDRRAQGARRRPHHPRAGGAAGLQQDVAVRRDHGLRPAGGPLDRHRAGALLPGAAAREVRRLHPAPSAQARDHRHARAQQHGQPRRFDLRAPPVGAHRRAAGAGGARLPGSARGVRRRRRCGSRSRRSTTRCPTPCSPRC